MIIPGAIDRPSHRANCSIDLPKLGKYRRTMALLRVWDVLDRRGTMSPIDRMLERAVGEHL